MKKYLAEFADQIKKDMSRGLSKESAAAGLGLTIDDLVVWSHKYILSDAGKYELNPHFENTFLEALKEGELQELRFWEMLGISQATGQRQGSSQAWSQMMKLREKYMTSLASVNEKIYVAKVADIKAISDRIQHIMRGVNMGIIPVERSVQYLDMYAKGVEVARQAVDYDEVVKNFGSPLDD